MTMSNPNNIRIAKNAIYMYVRMLVMMLVSLYTTRIVLKTLGIDDYGIYNVVGGIVVFFSFINSGLAGATKRYILAELAVGNLLSQRKVFSLAINVHLLIVAIIIIAGETIGLWILYHAMNIPENRIHAASVVYQASLFTAIIGILQSPFSSVIISYERMSVYAYFSILDVLLKLGIVFLIQAIDDDKLIWYSVLLGLIAVFDIIMYIIYCRFHFEACRYVKTKDNEIFFSILHYVGWTVFGSGANVLSKQGVSILLNNFFTVAVNAAMGICNMIVNAASQFVSNLQVAFAPQLTKNYISKDYPTLMELVFRSSRYTSFLLLIILIPVFFVISDLLEIWLETYPKYTEEFCILTLVCVYVEAVSMPLTTVITAEKNIRNYQLYISSLYLLCFVLCWCVLLYGVLPYVVLIVRLVVDLIMVSVRLWFIKKKVSIFATRKWCFESYAKPFMMLFLAFPLFPVLNCFEIEQTLLRFLIFSIVSLIWIVFTIYLVGFTEDERSFVLKKLRKY